MELSAASQKLSQLECPCLVVYAASADKKLIFELKEKEMAKVSALVHGVFDSGRFKASLKEAVFFRNASVCGFENVLVVGMGAKNKINDETLRLVTAAAVKNLNKEKIECATLAVETFRRFLPQAFSAGRAAAEGALLGSYKYEELKTKKGDEKKVSGLCTLQFGLSDKSVLKKFMDGARVGEITSNATNFVRDIANAPGNYLTPTVLAKRAEEAAKGTKIKFKALGKKEISALKMGAFLGVNQGSHEEPRFIIMEYFGGKKSQKPVVLVGKGLTFDTGGISIKPSAQMEEMKFDMCGGGAVIGAILALARMKAKVNVVALVPSTDNMPGGGALKPGDVVTAMNGKTIEVNNTDAEGRLILSDALAYACEKYKPSAILDAATLTGACVVALGNVFAGFFCKDKNLLKKINAAAESSGERIWQLPLVDEYVDDMKGTYADLSNIANSAKGAGSSLGAAFLSQFVNEDIPWAHLILQALLTTRGLATHTTLTKGHLVVL
ncbi:MAG: leucyl aminopeptidase [Oligoflexia bacterium]|nr:leucyl aminopeptidase [Oligoflexia bacterium]